MRVLLDPSILVCYLLRPRNPIRSIVHAALVGAYTPVISELLLDELAATIADKETMGTRFSAEQSADFIGDLKVVATRFPNLSIEIRSVTRDFYTDYMIACALEAEAEIVVSGDRDLLLLGREGNLSFVNPAGFLRFLSSNP
jgi:predicted nucleic acid-binding protein